MAREIMWAKGADEVVVTKKVGRSKNKPVERLAFCSSKSLCLGEHTVSVLLRKRVGKVRSGHGRNMAKYGGPTMHFGNGLRFYLSLYVQLSIIWRFSRSSQHTYICASPLSSFPLGDAPGAPRRITRIGEQDITRLGG